MIILYASHMDVWNEPELTIHRGAGVAGVTAAVSLPLYQRWPPCLHIKCSCVQKTEIALRQWDWWLSPGWVPRPHWRAYAWCELRQRARWPSVYSRSRSELGKLLQCLFEEGYRWFTYWYQVQGTVQGDGPENPIHTLVNHSTRILLFYAANAFLIGQEEQHHHPVCMEVEKSRYDC